MNHKTALLYTAILSVIVSACNLAAIPMPTPTRAAPATETLAPVTATPAPSEAASPPPTDTLTPTPKATATETASPSPTAIPTYTILRGTVNVEKVSCRYGPGAMYLYLYGMVQGATQDVIGRTDTGAWLLTKSHGDNKSCWVKASFLTLNGDAASLEVVYPDKYTLLPSSQHYLFPYDVAAIRSGSQVTISWKSEAMHPGDEESASMVIYIIETWTCVNGQLTFKPIGTSVAQITVTDEPGCSQPSHGRIYFQEKHGYTGPSEIPWPPAPKP